MRLHEHLLDLPRAGRTSYSSIQAPNYGHFEALKPVFGSAKCPRKGDSFAARTRTRNAAREMLQPMDKLPKYLCPKYLKLSGTI